MKNLRKINATFLWLSMVIIAVLVIIWVSGMALHELGNQAASVSLKKPFIYTGVAEAIAFTIFAIGAATEILIEHLNEN